jgi:hypothetical protein
LRPDFMGKNGFVWWQGVVEDIMDPLKLGRVRVRVLGWHTENKSEIPTDSLPWASVILPANSPFISGKGWSPNGLLQGCWVVGFFRDGVNAQEPVVFGTMGGMNLVSIPVPERKDIPTSYLVTGRADQWIKTKMKAVRDKVLSLYKATRNDVNIKPQQMPKNPAVNTNQGFTDPLGTYPLISRMGEPDTNRLARAENIGATVVNKKNSSRISTETALAGYWAEPLSPYAAQYPYNHVYESEAGHIVEYDDTPGAERMHWYHCAGTFTEIHPKGSEVHKVVGNAWDITLNDKMILVQGNASFNSGKTLKIRMGKDLDIEVGGDAKMMIKGNLTTDVGGNFLHKVKGTYTAVSEGPMLLMAPRIDLNPAGEQPSVVDTLLEKARGFINGLISAMTPPDTTVQEPLPEEPQVESTLSTVTVKNGVATLESSQNMTEKQKQEAIRQAKEQISKTERASSLFTKTGRKAQLNTISSLVYTDMSDEEIIETVNSVDGIENMSRTEQIDATKRYAKSKGYI